MVLTTLDEQRVVAAATPAAGDPAAAQGIYPAMSHALAIRFGALLAAIALLSLSLWSPRKEMPSNPYEDGVRRALVQPGHLGLPTDDETRELEEAIGRATGPR